MSVIVVTSSPRALIVKVVTQVARLVSIGQLPSGRTERTKNSTPLRATGCADSPILARLSVTKLVSGVASRKPPLVGWIFVRTDRLRRRASQRMSLVNGFQGGR